MKTTLSGKAYVLGNDVDTDQIIPAEYLTYSPAVPEERRLFGRYALSGVPAERAGLPDGHVPFVDPADPDNTVSAFSIIIGGKNFGCGSSREHAPLALAEAGVGAVVANSYARIFYRNAVNGGYLVPFETDDRLFEIIRTGDPVEISLADQCLVNRSTGRTFALRPLGEVAAIIEAGGLFPYARQVGTL